MSRPLIEEMAESLRMEPAHISSVLEEFILQLHKRLFEYGEFNRDYLGEEFRREISDQAFYHMLGFLEIFSERYEWSPGTAGEYLLRHGSTAHWLPYKHQIESWVNGLGEA